VDEGKLPYSLDARIKAARDVTQADDRFRAYRCDVERLIEGLTPFRVIRDMMAHGMLLLSKDAAGRHRLDYRMYHAAKGGGVEVGLMSTDVDQLAYAAADIGKFAQELLTVWRRIYSDQGLQPVA
jgi:hypothetical protein